jgi:hypothetical protein
MGFLARHLLRNRQLIDLYNLDPPRSWRAWLSTVPITVKLGESPIHGGTLPSTPSWQMATALLRASSSIV